jgi:hypothetical protein
MIFGVEGENEHDTPELLDGYSLPSLCLVVTMLYSYRE